MAEEEPTFWFHFVAESPSKRIQRLVSKTDGEELESTFLDELNNILKDGGLVYPVGMGADMIAYSRPDLKFVIKFPYEDFSNLIRPRFSKAIQARFAFAKRYLGGLFAPSTEVATSLTDMVRNHYNMVTIIQQKVVTVKERMLTSQEESEIEAIHKNFIELNQQMWRRGIYDDDPDWEPNYGFLPDDSMVAIDGGGLSRNGKSFPFYLGLPRTRLYEAALKGTFQGDNFKRFFRKQLSDRRPTVRVLI